MPQESKPRIRHEMIKVIGSLEVVRTYARRLKIAGIVDQFCPMRDLEDTLTHGQVIEGLVANRLSAPLPLYEIEEWARNFAVEELLGFRPEQLNDDRLGRALEALAPRVEAVRGAVGLQAIREFGIEVSKFHWDLTSLVFTGEYDHQDPAFPIVEYGYSSNRGDHGKKQVRSGLAATQDGALPLWHDVLAGHTADVTTVVETMNNLRDHLQVSNFLLIGDSKLLCYENMFALHRAGNYFLGPLAARPELDQEFLSLNPESWPCLKYVSERDRLKPREKRIQYWATEVEWSLVDPGAKKPVTFRKVFVISSEERAACRKNRARQMKRAKEDVAKVQAALRNRRYYRSREQILEKVNQLLTKRKVQAFFTPCVYEAKGRWHLGLRVNRRALQAAEALDGYYVLCTNLPRAKADTLHVFTDWKKQSEIERRFANVKGPLRVRPVFLKKNDRIVALVTVILLALTIFCLIEREVRRKLKDTDGVMRGLLPENRPTRATGQKILRALRTQTLILSTLDGHPCVARGPMTEVQRKLLELLEVPPTEFG